MADEPTQQTTEEEVAAQQNEQAGLEKLEEREEKLKEQIKRDKEAASTALTMEIKVHSPFKNYYEDVADSISAVNDTGPFDILARHKNFMTLLSPCEIVIRKKDTEDFKLKITRGIMHVKADKVVVFLDV